MKLCTMCTLCSLGHESPGCSPKGSPRTVLRLWLCIVGLQLKNPLILFYRTALGGLIETYIRPLAYSMNVLLYRMGITHSSETLRFLSVMYTVGAVSIDSIRWPLIKCFKLTHRLARVIMRCRSELLEFRCTSFNKF